MFLHLLLGLSSSLLPVGFSTKLLYVLLRSLTPHLSPSRLHLIDDDDDDDNCNWVWHPVAAVQYSTHKQYTEQNNETEYPERNTYRTT